MDEGKKKLLDQVLEGAPDEFELTITVKLFNEYLKEKLQYK